MTTSKSPPLQLEINGEPRSVRDPMTVAELVAELGLEGRQVAIEHNRRLVPRDDHATTRLASGDRLEIVTLLGGG